jgi:hypothetical protein
METEKLIALRLVDCFGGRFYDDDVHNRALLLVIDNF